MSMQTELAAMTARAEAAEKARDHLAIALARVLEERDNRDDALTELLRDLEAERYGYSPRHRAS